MRVAVVVGTRPEVIKMAPVVRALRSRGATDTILCATGQHRELLKQALADFGLTPDHDLKVMSRGQSLARLTRRLIQGVDDFLRETTPDWLLVQGDTTTAFAASLCAFYLGVRVGHVEAGLRSFQKRAPFPEEANRRMTAVLADLHFAPTSGARDNLLREGVPAGDVLVTGNTIVDALMWMREQVRTEHWRLPDEVAQALEAQKKIILLTCHRRESFGAPIERIFSAVRTIATRHDDCLVVYPVHLNPNVRQAARRLLGRRRNILLIDPVPYRTLVALLDSCHIVLTDSGGIQEEAPSLKKPVLVLREVTERPEGVEAGVARLVGADPGKIVGEVERLIVDPTAYGSMATAANPYGDGHAAGRIVSALHE